MGNLEIWDKVKHVDASATKQANVDGNKQTSINTLYPVKLMTEALGPIGKNWKYEIDYERFDNTKPMMMKGEHVKDGDNLLWEQTHTLCLNLYVKHEGETEFSRYQHFGHTKYRYVTQTGKIMVDHEYAKKSVSDALKKALSLLGVCADVYSGDFDDVHYRAEVQDKLAIEKADKSAEEEAKQVEEMKEKVEGTLKAMDQVPNERAAKLLWTNAIKALPSSSNWKASVNTSCSTQINNVFIIFNSDSVNSIVLLSFIKKGLLAPLLINSSTKTFWRIFTLSCYAIFSSRNNNCFMGIKRA